jgi:hypothetical protein
VISRIAALALAAAALVGCGGGGANSPTPTTQRAGPVKIRVQIKGAKPVGGIARASAHKGQRVQLIVHSDVADEVHLHGYDLHKDVEAGGTATIRFIASVAGVFEAELENRKLQILELTVR